MTSSVPPSSETPNAQQYHVVAACDLSPLGDRVIEEALLLCGTRPHTALFVITAAAAHARGVVLPGDKRVLNYEVAQQAGHDRVAGVVDRFFAATGGVRLEKINFYLTIGEPAACICSLAKEVDGDVIVLGAHDRRGLGRMLHTSLHGEVMRRAPCGVLVIRPRDFLSGEKLPEVQPPLQPGEHHLLGFHEPQTYHYVPRASRPPSRIMPAL